MFHSVNFEQGLYVLSHGGGYTCLGFDVALRQAAAVRKWLTENGVPVYPENPGNRGTEAGYRDYERMMAAGSELNIRTKKRCNADLVPELVPHEGHRVEVVDCYGETRRFIVGKSCGWMPIHLEIKTKRSMGGGGVYGTPLKSVRRV